MNSTFFIQEIYNRNYDKIKHTSDQSFLKYTPATDICMTQ